MKIIDLYEKINTEIKLHKICKNGNVVFIKELDFSNEVYKGIRLHKYDYEKIYILDINNNLKEIKGKFYDITYENGGNSIFYITLSKINGIDFIDFYRTNVSNGNSNKIGSRIFDTSKPNYEFINNHYLFKVLNDRYAICINKDSLNKMAILIDSKENQLYDIRTELNNEDSLLDYDLIDCYYIDDDNFLFKTGSICIYEKEDLLKYGHRNNEKEQLFIFNVDEFVEHIKNNRKINYKLLEFKGDYGSIEVINVNKNNIYYIDADFNKNTSTIKKYYINTEEVEEVVQDNYIYKCINFKIFNGNIYRIDYNDEGFITEIVNIISNEKYNITLDSQFVNIIYFDEKKLIYDKVHMYLSEDEESIITSDLMTIVYDMKNKKEINKFKDRYGKYIEEYDRLILHK
jgi:hypothetical protein